MSAFLSKEKGSSYTFYNAAVFEMFFKLVEVVAILGISIRYSIEWTFYCLFY